MSGTTLIVNEAVTMFLPAKPGGNHIDIGLRLFHGDAGLKPRQDVVVLRAVVVGVLGLLERRHKEIRFIDTGDGRNNLVIETKTWRENTDHGMRATVERDCAPHNIGIACELTLPEAIRKHHGLRFS